MNRKLVAALLLQAMAWIVGCGVGDPSGGDPEKRTYLDFLSRKLPFKHAGAQIEEWKPVVDQGRKTISIGFRANNAAGTPVLWTGTMILEDGKVVSKSAVCPGATIPVGTPFPAIGSYDMGTTIRE